MAVAQEDGQRPQNGLLLAVPGPQTDRWVNLLR